MNVGEIIEQVGLLIHNDMTNPQFVSKMNQLSRQLFRKFPTPEVIYKFVTEEYGYYTLPDDCAEDRIRCVIIDNVEYKRFIPEESNPNDRFCSVIAGMLYVHPNESGKFAYLYYGQRHVELSASKLSDVPSLPEDYHELLVYGLAKWVAGIQRDVDMVNNFQNEYNELEKMAIRGVRKMGLKRVRITTNW